MAKQRSSRKKKIHGILKLKVVIAKFMQNSLLRGKRSYSIRCNNQDEDDIGDPTDYFVPEDVKEGHFVAIAVDGNEPKGRFVVPLRFLAHPRFLELLEQAAEEYGFYHEGGALMVPCRPSELEMILAEEFARGR